MKKKLAQLLIETVEVLDEGYKSDPKKKELVNQ